MERGAERKAHGVEREDIAKSMNKIAFVVPYFGKWPVWFPAFLQSVRYNPDIDWLFFTDCPEPPRHPKNTRFIPFGMAELLKLFSRKLGFEVKFPNAYKLCEFKPAYGAIFQDYLANYNFWGHCDIDLIFGSIKRFITEEVFENYDVITAFNKEVEGRRFCGHFTLYRNIEAVNNLFRDNPRHKDIFQKENYVGYDESKMAYIVKRAMDSGRTRALWGGYSIDVPLNKLYTGRYLWSEGKLYENRREIMYVHFIFWKGWMKKCFSYHNNPRSFYISFSHIGGRYSALSALRVVVGKLKTFLTKRRR